VESIKAVRAFLAYAWRRRRAGVLALGLLASGCQPGSDPASDPPNVLIYVIDTLRRDSLGSYGNTRVPTPNIDAAAREGVVFEQATSPSSWTRASMATLLTGFDPPAHGAVDRRDALPRDLPTLAERLREHGYAAGFVTSNPNVGTPFGFDRGFDEITELYGRREPGYVRVEELTTRSDEVVATALDWLDRAAHPFLLVVLAIDPHSPYQPPPEFDRFGPADADIDGSQASLQRRDLDAAQRARIRGLYDAEVAYSDAEFGKLVAGLRERRLLDETLLVITSDHGEEFWERGVRGHGLSLAEASIRIPLIVRFPGSQRVAAGTRRGDPAGLDDLVPSVLDLLGLPGDGALPGRSLFGEHAPAPTFASLSLEGRSLAAAREPRWKLVWDLAADTRALYDLELDPLERSPVPRDASSEASAAHERLSQSIARRLAERRGNGGEEVGALPEDVEATLRALGYLED
jgi:arylsulfatase A-like enzyme